MRFTVYTQGGPSFDIAEMCVGAMLRKAAARWPNRVGWVIEDVSITFREMHARADTMARSLIACGIGRGDVVAVWTPNLPEFVYLKFACARVGAVFTAINTRSKSFEVGHILRHSEAKLLVMVDRFLKHDFVATLAEFCPPRTRRAQGWVDAPELPQLKRVVTLSKRAGRESLRWDDFEALGATISPGTLADIESSQRWDDPILLQYTSGTTARPKGALCDHRYVLYASVERLVRAGLGPDDSFLNTQPFYHVGGSGILTVPLVIGCRVVCAEYYEVERIFALIERNGCTVRSGHAAMYTMELNHPALRDYRLDSLRAGWCIGPPALMQQVRDTMGIPFLVQIYGMSEGGGAGGHWQEPWEVRSATCGRVLTGLELAIRDADSGRDVPAGQVGEICTRGWLRMCGYLRQPEETARAIDAEGWLHSGDLGVVDPAGYLRFVGRMKDMLRIGGENVSAEEVESVLLSHPGVAQAAVIAAPDDRLTEVVMAVIEPRGGARIGEADVISFCRERMANFRVPRYVRFVESWPLTGSGKIQKNVLRETYLAGK